MRMIPAPAAARCGASCSAAVVVIGATAATTAVAGLLQFKQLAADSAVAPAIPHAHDQDRQPRVIRRRC